VADLGGDRLDLEITNDTGFTPLHSIRPVSPL
jgi:hypothetical protein